MVFAQKLGVQEEKLGVQEENPLKLPFWVKKPLS